MYVVVERFVHAHPHHAFRGLNRERCVLRDVARQRRRGGTDVTSEREVHPVARGRTVQCTNRRPVEAVQSRWRGVTKIEVRGACAVRQTTGDAAAAQIETRAEEPPCCGDDDRAHVGVFIGREQMPRQCVAHAPERLWRAPLHLLLADVVARFARDAQIRAIGAPFGPRCDGHDAATAGALDRVEG